MFFVKELCLNLYMMCDFNLKKKYCIEITFIFSVFGSLLGGKISILFSKNKKK